MNQYAQFQLLKMHGFEKRLISKDLNNKEVTLQLKINNDEKDKSLTNNVTGELVLVLDNSNSMTENVASQNKTRQEVVFSSAKTLISNLLKDNTNLKISVVSFSTKSITEEATLEDAKLVSTLSNDANALNTAIDSIVANGPRTDLESGLTLGLQQFSKENNNKYMVVLTDGVPNVAINQNNPYYSDAVISQTKSALTAIANSNVKLYTMLTGINNPEQTTDTSKTFSQIITEIFGTESQPTAGTFYYITDDKIESTINTIYESLKSTTTVVKSTLKNITVVDYFPQEIIDNFDFAYVSEANIGNISATIDKANNSITWTIPELESGKTAIVQYKLKLKENFNSSIVAKIINTNQKVDLTYTDFDDKEQTKTSDVTPKLKLTEPPAVLPKAGTITLVSLAVLSLGLFGYSITKLISVHKKMN